MHLHWILPATCVYRHTEAGTGWSQNPLQRRGQEVIRPGTGWVTVDEKKSTGLWFFGAEGKQWVKSTIIFGKWPSICEPVIIAVFSRLIVSGIWKQVKSCLWGEKAQSLLLWLGAQAQEVHRLEEQHKHTLIPCLHLALAWTHHSPPAHSHWVFVFWASASI